MTLFRALWSYRHYVWSAVINDYKSRYVRSRFGLAWVVLNPLAQVVIYATILSTVLAARLPGIDSKFAYVAYLLAGMLCWNLFAEIIGKCLTLFMDNASMLKKLNFPRVVLPGVVVTSAVVSNLALAAATLVILPLVGFPVHITWLWVPILGALTVMLAVGIGLIVGVINVFARDFGQVFGIVLQFWFWLTPVVYPDNVLPAQVAFFARINPMFILVKAYHTVIVYGQDPSLLGIAWITVLSVLFLVVGWAFFRRASAELVDEL